jgi:hypothetical protein
VGLWQETWLLDLLGTVPPVFHLLLGPSKLGKGMYPGLNCMVISRRVRLQVTLIVIIVGGQLGSAPTFPSLKSALLGVPTPSRLRALRPEGGAVGSRGRRTRDLVRLRRLLPPHVLALPARVVPVRQLPVLCSVLRLGAGYGGGDARVPGGAETAAERAADRGVRLAGAWGGAGRAAAPRTRTGTFRPSSRLLGAF